MQNTAVSITGFFLGDAGLIGVSAVSLAEDSVQRSGVRQKVPMNRKQTQLCREESCQDRSQSCHYCGGLVSFPGQNVTENMILVSL